MHLCSRPVLCCAVLCRPWLLTVPCIAPMHHPQEGAGQVLSLCFRSYCTNRSSPTVVSTASATVRQAVALVFDHTGAELVMASPGSGLQGREIVAVLLLQDLLHMCAGGCGCECFPNPGCAGVCGCKLRGLVPKLGVQRYSAGMVPASGHLAASPVPAAAGGAFQRAKMHVELASNRHKPPEYHCVDDNVIFFYCQRGTVLQQTCLPGVRFLPALIDSCPVLSCIPLPCPTWHRLACWWHNNGQTTQQASSRSG